MLALAGEKGLTSDEHPGLARRAGFTVDGTLIEAWAGNKSYRRRHKGSGEGPDEPGAGSGEDFHGEKRTNATHQSTTDPQAKLYRKGVGKEAKLCYLGHVLMEPAPRFLVENRNGLVVDARLTQATGTAEREAAEEMVRAAKCRHRGRLTVGGDKGFDTQGFVAELRAMGVTPHVAQNERHRRSAIDGRTTRHKGYELSQLKRKLIEKVLGWMKTVGTLRKTRHRGVLRVSWMYILCLAAFDLVRIRTLEAARA